MGDKKSETLSIKESLFKLGYKLVQLVFSSADAVHKCQGFDLVIMNLELENCLEVIKNGEQIQTLNIPVLFITSDYQESLFQKALAIKPYGYLIKPFDSVQLRFSIELALKNQERDKKFKRDLIERKKWEEKLQDNFNFVENLLETIPYPTFYKDADFVHHGCNKAFEKFSGFSEEEIVGKSVFDLYPPELAEQYHEKDLEIIENPQLQTFEAPIIDSKGFKHVMLFKKDVYYDHEGRVAGIISLMVDMTELRKSEKDLKESEELLRGLFDNMPNGISVFEVKHEGLYGKDYIIKEINETGLKIEGKTREEVIGKSLYDLRPNIDEFGLIKIFKSVWETGNALQYPATLYVDDNYENWFENYVFKTPSGELVSIYSDVTEEKNVEESLKISEHKFQYFIENSPLAIAIHDKDGKIQLLNRKATELTGYDQNDLPNLESWLENAYPDYDYCQKIMSEWDDALSKGEDNLTPIIGEIICKDGTNKIIEFYGRIIGESTIIILNDITERKKADDLLIASEKRLFDLIDFLPDATFAVDRGGNVISWNRAMEDLTGIQTEDIMGKGNFEYALPFYHERRPILIDLVMDNHREHEKFYHDINWEGDTIIAETEAVFHEKLHILWGKAVPIYDEELKINGAIETIRDITDRKKAETAMMDSLKEKEVLLREIHHRVKNNLQIIASLLSLQHSYVVEEESKDVLKESQGRVKAMANIHEKLYQSPQLTNLNFKTYLHKLISELFLTYGIGSDRIKYQITVKNVEIGLDTAIPCGLIINELVTNSLKYAFPEDRTGIVQVIFLEENNYYTLTVSDNGIGLPEDFNPDNTDSLGLQLVKSLVNQIDGTLDIDGNEGTTFIIEFEETLYPKRL